MRSSLPLRGYSSGSGIIPLQQHDQSIVDVEFGKAKDAPSSTFFFVPLLSALGNPVEYAFGLRQASAEAEEVYPGTRQTSLPQTGTCLPSRRPLPRQGSLPGTRNGGDLSSTRPNFAGGRSRPQTSACLPSRKLRSPKQAPVYHRADCVTPNRRLFNLAQIA